MSIYIDFNKSPVEYSVHYCRGCRTTKDVQSVLKDEYADGWLILVFGEPDPKILTRFQERWPRGDDEDPTHPWGSNYQFWETQELHDAWWNEEISK
jgi:hypothetical protein